MPASTPSQSLRILNRQVAHRRRLLPSPVETCSSRLSFQARRKELAQKAQFRIASLRPAARKLTASEQSHALVAWNVVFPHARPSHAHVRGRMNRLDS